MQQITKVFLDTHKNAMVFETQDGILNKDGLRVVNLENDSHFCYVFLEIAEASMSEERTIGNLLLRGIFNNDNGIDWPYGSPLKFESALKNGMKPWVRLALASLISETLSSTIEAPHVKEMYLNYSSNKVDNITFGRFYTRNVIRYIKDDGNTQDTYTIFILPINAIRGLNRNKAPF